MAGIEIRTNRRFALKWEYLSRRRPEFAQKEYMHTGMTRVDAILDDETEVCMKGDYFNDKSRHFYGPIEMRKLQVVKKKKA